MGSRPLRQHYEGLRATVGIAPTTVVSAWQAHRRRFIAALESFDEPQWRATTRCTAWNANDVVAHLTTVDAFWMVSLTAARGAVAPTAALRGFDPSTSLEPLVDAMRSIATPDLLAQFAAGSNALGAVMEEFSDDEWAHIGESPFGHIEARFLAMHACWDSWLHERDILVPLDRAAPVTADELLVATAFTFFVAGAQGGLLDDPAPVGSGLAGPIDVSLRFDDLEDVIRVRLDADVRIDVGAPPGIGAEALPAGSALDLVDRFAGRRPYRFDALPHPELAAQCARAAQIL